MRAIRIIIIALFVLAGFLLYGLVHKYLSPEFPHFVEFLDSGGLNLIHAGLVGVAIAFAVVIDWVNVKLRQKRKNDV